MFRKSRIGALVAGASLVAVLAACGGGGLTNDSGDAGTGDGDILLGMLTPLSGGSASIGPYMRNGGQFAVDEINKAGGVLGRQLKLIVEDEACDPKTAAAGAAKLVTQKVAVSVGGYCSSATLPTLSIFARANIPMIIPAANSNDLLKEKHKNVFLINGTGAQQAQAAVDFMKSEGVKAIALVDDNTSYSKDITTRTAEDLQSAPEIKVVNQQSVTAGESDYSAAVTAVLRAKPDFIYWTGYFQEGGLLTKQLRGAGYTGKIMVADGSVDKQLVSIAGNENAQGVFATMTQTPQTIPGGQEWIAKFKESTGADPGPYSPQAYDAVRVAAEAIKQAGSTKADDVIAALEQIDGFQIFSGKLKFTPEHTLAEGGFDILVVKGDNFELNQ